MLLSVLIKERNGYLPFTVGSSSRESFAICNKGLGYFDDIMLIFVRSDPMMELQVETGIRFWDGTRDKNHPVMDQSRSASFSSFSSSLLSFFYGRHHSILYFIAYFIRMTMRP
jgi:hypothetical protein